MAWLIPTEIVEELATSTGSVLLMRARMRGAITTPLASLSIRADRYVAELEFAEPIGPERERGLVLMLRVPPGGAIGRSRARRSAGA